MSKTDKRQLAERQMALAKSGRLALIDALPLRLLVAIITHADFVTCLAFPSLDTLVDMVDRSIQPHRTRVTKALITLEDGGYIRTLSERQIIDEFPTTEHKRLQKYRVFSRGVAVREFVGVEGDANLFDAADGGVATVATPPGVTRDALQATMATPPSGLGGSEGVAMVAEGVATKATRTSISTSTLNSNLTCQVKVPEEDVGERFALPNEEALIRSMNPSLKMAMTDEDELLAVIEQGRQSGADPWMVKQAMLTRCGVGSAIAEITRDNTITPDDVLRASQDCPNAGLLVWRLQNRESRMEGSR